MARPSRGSLRIVRRFAPNTSSLYNFLVNDGIEKDEIRRLVSDTPGMGQFLRETLISCNSPISIKRDTLVTSMSEVITRVIERLLAKQRFSRVGNVLAIGYRFANEGAQTHFDGIETYYPNTLLDHLKTPPWTCLLSFLGDHAISAILESCSVFVVLEDGAHLQVTGPALSEQKDLAIVEPKKRQTLDRHLIFYNHSNRKKFKRPFLRANIDQLAKALFYRNNPGAGRLSEGYQSMARMIRKKIKSCPIDEIFDSICKVDRGLIKVIPSNEDGLLSQDEDIAIIDRACISTEASVEERSVLSYSIPYEKVVGFILTILKLIVPTPLMNLRKLIKKKVILLINLRRFETLSINEMIKGISLNDFPIFHPSKRASKESNIEATGHFQSFISWLFQDFLIPLVRSYFYVTETVTYRNKLFYFRKDVWNHITGPFLRKMQEEMFFEEDLRSVQRPASCKLRLIPKGSTFRPVMNLSSRKGGMTRATPARVRNVLEVLNYLAMKQPSLLGAGVLGFDEIANRLTNYKRAMSYQNCLFMVKLDVKACFDSIPHEKLIEVLVQRVLPKEEYTIQKYDVIKFIHGRPFKLFKKYASPCSDFSNLPAHLRQKKVAKKTMDRRRAGGSARIIVDKVAGSHLDRNEILAILHDHICCNYVKVGDRMCVQRVGIPQGSILSSMLCSLIYGDLDRHHLTPFLNDPHSLFVRFIDDMLFISDSYMKAAHFLETASKGFLEYGVQINDGKTTANFFHPLVTKKVPRQHTPFPWCGLLLDQATLEVQGDYGKFFGSYASDSLSIQRVTRPIEAFSRQLKIFLKPKLKEIFLLPELNSPLTVTTNLYQNFVYTAVKAHVYLRELRRRNIAWIRPEILIRAMEDCIRFVENTVSNWNSFRFPIEWLFCCAFLEVFGRKPTAYQGTVLDFLRAQSRDLPERPWPIPYDQVLASGEIIRSQILH